MVLLFRSPTAATRLARARAWLSAHPLDAELVIVAATAEAANELLRDDVAASGARFGAERTTVGRLAGALAAEELARRGLTPIGGAALEAVGARVVHALDGTGALGRLAAIADRPGLPRAIVRTVTELRLAGVTPAALDDPDLRRVLEAFEIELVRSKVVDRAGVLALATARVRERPPPPRPLLFLDVPLPDARTTAFAAAIGATAPDVLATVVAGDARTAARFASALGAPVTDAPADVTAPIAALHARLFGEAEARPAPADALTIVSAPGESRECVELARKLHREAERGVPFDRIAVLLHAPHAYRTHLVEALRRAGIPAHFARGTLRPDPAGRAFLSLLGCAAEGLSATRFAEYLSLGECPEQTDDGAPLPAPPAADRFVPPDEELSPAIAPPPLDEAPADADPPLDLDAPIVAGSLRTPRLFEKLLLDAAVIGGLDRWRRRLAALARVHEAERAELDDPSSPQARRLDRERLALDALRRWALPLLADLAALPSAARWGKWTDALSAIAARALREPARVHAVLAELAPMAAVGPVDLTEVRHVLERRLGEIVARPSGPRDGRVFVGTPAEARGLSFEVVLIPGLAEKLFPQRVVEDPLLSDAARARTSAELETNPDRSAAERLALRIAVGAARRRVVASYPRLDLEAARPRTPSFYGLELLRAAEGALPGFDELARRAESAAPARVGWPAPDDAAEAIDDVEHDLSILDGVLRRPEAETIGLAAYLLATNVHLARALRFRGRRWNVRKWTYADGMVTAEPAALAALAEHSLSARSFSPTALQHYASCPYRFFLHAVHRLAPRQVPVAIEELDPLQRGSLVHETQYELLGALRAADLLPVRPATLERARVLLDESVDRVIARWQDDLAPAIDRVWRDAIASIKADLREWLRRTSESPGWTPTHGELSFGLPRGDERDPASVDEPVALDCGLRLRGSIDLVERADDGALRATDHKTGKAWAKPGTVIGGGETLQPALYALALEKLFPSARVAGGRLYYCTSTGGFAEVDVPLDDAARSSVSLVAATVDAALRGGFLPAAPDERACERCDYARVCGPYEERRVGRHKRHDELAPLVVLRGKP